MKGTIINIGKIPMLWAGHETEFIQYHVLRDQIKVIIANSYPKGHIKYGLEVEERTIMRYLQSLIDEEKLEKKIDPDHKTYYRPVNPAVVSKEILQTQIESGKLSYAEIPEVSPERFEKIAEQLKQVYADLNVNLFMDKANKLEKQLNAEILPQGENSGTIPFFSWLTTVAQNAESEKRLKKGLVELFGRVKIQIVTSPGETAPILTDDDIIQLSTIVFPKIMDENKGKPREKPFQLIISYPN